MLSEGKVHIRNINKVIKRNEYNTSYTGNCYVPSFTRTEITDDLADILVQPSEKY